VAWGIWLTRNAKIFEDKDISPPQCVIQDLNILGSFKQVLTIKVLGNIVEEFIDRKRSWSYFDGAFQGNPPMGGTNITSYFGFGTWIISFSSFWRFLASDKMVKEGMC
jgi:hypothetical protein